MSILVFNTNRFYTDNGQRIAAKKMPCGRVAFLDIDRNIDGVTREEIRLTREDLMLAYDHGHYTGGFYSLGLPTFTDDMALTRELQGAALEAPRLAPVI